jgi:hypothetical protein
MFVCISARVCDCKFHAKLDFLLKKEVANKVLNITISFISICEFKVVWTYSQILL